MNTMFNGMFMKVQKGLCMLSPCGIAIKTSSGYRSYDTRSGKLRNCDNLVFSFGDGLFFVIPSAKVKPGDIILNGGKPACVRKAGRSSPSAMCLWATPGSTARSYPFSETVPPSAAKAASPR